MGISNFFLNLLAKWEIRKYVKSNTKVLQDLQAKEKINELNKKNDIESTLQELNKMLDKKMPDGRTYYKWWKDDVLKPWLKDTSFEDKYLRDPYKDNSENKNKN
jgi:hypothetical protein